MKLVFALLAASCATSPKPRESPCVAQRRVLRLLLEQPLEAHERDQITVRLADLDSRGCPTTP